MAFTHPVIAPIFDKKGVTLAEIARRSGAHRTTISGWRFSNGASIGNLEAVLNTIGYRLTIQPLVETTIQFMRRKRQ